MQQIDIWRTARLLLKQHGCDKALSVASGRAADLGLRAIGRALWCSRRSASASGSGSGSAVPMPPELTRLREAAISLVNWNHIIDVEL